jgi:hypothetical protein
MTAERGRSRAAGATRSAAGRPLPAPPEWTVPRTPGPWGAERDLAALRWQEIAALPELARSDGSGPAEQATRVRLAWDDAALYVRFEAEDRDAWGTLAQRDAPLYQEEVVEVFLAAGAEPPRDYFELEVSPLGVLFDARVSNPTGRRADLVADTSWDCPGLRWQAGRGGERQDWWAALAIPWQAVATAGGELPRVWRANFYRIERPRDGAAELSAWSPTFVSPADFHRPDRFGVLALGAGSRNR